MSWIRPALLAGSAIGLFAGLVEGLLSIPLMHIGYVPELWYDILWTAPLIDAAFVVGGAVVAGLLGRAIRARWAGAFGVFGAFFIAVTIWLGLVLPWQVRTIALLLLSAGLAKLLSTWFLRREAAALRLCRRAIPVLLAATLVLFAGVRGGGAALEAWRSARLPAAPANAPRILVIVVDALRADHLASNGYGRVTSPVLDSLAAAGVSFGAAFAAAPYTAPSHASLLTGLFPYEHGVQWGERRPKLGPGPLTIGEWLQGRGYRTGAFSANRFWFTREQGFGRGFLHFEDRYQHAGDAVARTAYGRKLDDLVLQRFMDDYPWRERATAITDAALDWIDRDAGRPFFVFLNYFDVHDPYLPPAAYRTAFGESASAPGVINSYLGRYHPTLTPAELQAEIDAYDESIRYVDTEIGRLLAELERRGLADDLLVIVTSDHGEAFGEHGTYVHANAVYREEIHVPLIVHRRGRVPAGARPDVAVTHASIPATIAELVGGPVPAGFRAPSLVPLWTDPAAVAGWPLPVSEMEHWPWMHEAAPSHAGAMRSVQSDSLHLIEHDSTGVSLYNWRHDPRERRDLAGQSEYAARLDSLLARLASVRQSCRQTQGCE